MKKQISDLQQRILSKHSARKKINPNTVPRSVLVDEYRKLLKERNDLKAKYENAKSSQKDILGRWRKKYGKLSWRFFKQSQKVYAIRMANIKKNKQLKESVSIARREMIESMNKTRLRKTKEINKIFAAGSILSLKTKTPLHVISFLLWAYSYEKFARVDYTGEFGIANDSYYKLLNDCIRAKLIAKLGVKDNAGNVYCITEDGRKKARNIMKFIQKTYGAIGDS